MGKSDFEYIMNRLESIPLVKEHAGKPSTKMALKVVKRRLDLNLTRQELSEKGKEMGLDFTAHDVMKIESGHDDVPQETLDSVIRCLGGIESFDESSASLSV